MIKLLTNVALIYYVAHIYVALEVAPPHANWLALAGIDRPESSRSEI